MRTENSSEREMMPIRTGIHPYTREILSRMHSRSVGEFSDNALEREHPHVDMGIRHAVWQVDKGLVAVWELQGDGEPRWHIYRHWSSGKLDTPTHFMLLTDMTRYVPLDWAAVEMIRVAHAERNPVEFVQQFLDRETERKGMVAVTKDGLERVSCKQMAANPGFLDDNPIVPKDEYYNMDSIRRYYRRLFKRNTWGTVGSCWERGSELPWMNYTPAQRNEV